MLNRLINKVKRKLKIPFSYTSETSKVRHLVLQYCKGEGCDIGFGGDKIKKDHCAGIDLPQPYTQTGKDQVDIPCDVIKEDIPVEDNTYDYVYTSHLIEDIPDTQAALKKFIRILKPSGTLILVFPDQPTYEAHCKKTGQPQNMYHVHADMGLDYMIKALDSLENIRYEVLFTSDRQIDYNVIMALQIFKS
jgi:SAM-dependent methyltransferase